MTIIEGFEPVGAHVSAPDISSAVTLSPPAGLPKNQAILVMQAIAKNVRYTLDGTTPTASRGFQMLAGEMPMVLQVTGDMTVKVIEELAASDLEHQWGK